MTVSIPRLDRVPFTNQTAAVVLGGTGHVSGGIAGIVTEDVEPGQPGQLAVLGHAEGVAKAVAADAWAARAVLYLVPATGLLTATATNNVRVGLASRASTAGESTADVYLVLA